MLRHLHLFSQPESLARLLRVRLVGLTQAHYKRQDQAMPQAKSVGAPADVMMRKKMLQSLPPLKPNFGLLEPTKALPHVGANHLEYLVAD